VENPPLEQEANELDGGGNASPMTPEIL